MSTEMEIILIKDLKGLGKFGDKKKVKRGYALNYLVPQGLGLLVNKDCLHRFEAIKKKEQKRLAQEKADAKAIKEVLSGKSFAFKAKGVEGGKLYGSITPSDVIDRIKEEYKIEVNKKCMKMPDHIKEAGSFDIEVIPHSDIIFKISLNIELEEAEKAKADK